jgi:cytochrome c-type biogenesis protein CcmE
MAVGLRWGAAGAVLAAALAYLVITATGSAAVTYQTVAEMRAQPPSGEARVLGTVKDDVERSSDGLEVRFTAEDGGASMPVVYKGTLPDIFRPGIRVVVEGRMGSDGVFHARTLLAKCPSRFTSGGSN